MNSPATFFRILAAASLAALFLFAHPVLSAEVVELAPGVYAFVGEKGATNSGFVVTDDGVVVIDTQGPRELALELRAWIRKVTDLPIAFVINTHYHGDHTFGNQYFNEARAIIAHEETWRALVEKDKAHRTRFKRFFGEESLLGFNPVLPSLTFTEKMVLRVGGRELVLVHPGVAHTFGDVYVFMPAEGVVFAGDLLYKKRLPLLGDGDTLGAISALDTLLQTGADVYLPGHGGVATKEDIVKFKKYLLDLRGEVTRFIDEGKTLEEVKDMIKLPEYSGYVMYKEWLGQNAGAVYREIKESQGKGK